MVQALNGLDIDVQLNPMPCELADAVPFHSDDAVRAYDGETARSYWRALVQTQRVFQIFRSRFGANAVRFICSGAVSILR